MTNLTNLSNAELNKRLVELDQSALKEVLSYDPDTGVFLRKITVSGNAKAGDEAGWVKRYKDKDLEYREIKIKTKVYKAHRLAWLYVTGEWPKGHIDHINGDGLDNRFCNLRDVSNQENSKNSSLSKSNKSGSNGVSWHKDHGKWYARIMVNGKSKHLGYYDSKDEAIEARLNADKEYGYHENHGRCSIMVLEQEGE